MTKKGLRSILFAFTVIAALSWINPACASIDDFDYDGDCSYSDGDVKTIYEEAYKITKRARDSLYTLADGGTFSCNDGNNCHGMTCCTNSFNVAGLKNLYENDNSPCAFLQSNSKELSATEMDLSGTAEDGAELYDKKYTKNPKCEKLTDDLEDNDYQEYTDWNIRHIREIAAKGSLQFQDIVEWAESAEDCDVFTLEGRRETLKDALKTILKQTMGPMPTDGWGANNDCEYIIMDVDYDCAPKPDKCGDWKNTLDPDCECKKTNIRKSFYCYDSGNVGSKLEYKNGCPVIDSAWKGYKFPSLEYFTKKTTPGLERCLQQLLDMEALRDIFAKMHQGANTLLDMITVIEKGKQEDVKISCTCEKDENGQETGKVEQCVAMDSDYDEDDIEQGCKPHTTYARELAAHCLICGLFASIAGADQAVSKSAFEATANGLISVLGIALLLYIAYTTLLAIASPETQKISKYLNSLMAQGLKVAVAILILQNPTFLYNELLSPILDSAVDFGIGMSSEVNKARVEELGSKYSRNFDMNSQYLPGGILVNLTGMVHSFQETAAEVPGMGRALLCLSFEDLPKIPNMGFIPRFTLMVNGVVLYVFGIMIMLAIGFYMLDCIISLGIVCALMAFFVACWPFKMTSGYTKVGWNMFLNVFFNFIMMGVIVNAIVQLTSFAVSGDSKERFVAEMLAGDVEAVEDSISLGGLHFVMMIICCMLCLKMPKESGRLANKFAAGAQVQMGAELGGTVANVAKQAAIGNPGAVNPETGKKQGIGGALGMAGKAAGGLASSAAEHSGAKGAASKAGKAVKNVANKALGKIGIGKNAKMGTKGRDKDANKQRDADFK